MTNSSFAQQREQLLARYIDSFGDKIDELTAELNKFDTVSDDTAMYDFTNLRLIVHKLAGSAGSYGFAEIGGLASALEKRLRTEENNIMSLNVVTTTTMELINELRKHSHS